ncbi:hypothetical protein REPUB_Repub10bG0074200 [Reevesia pubescens]
MEDGLEELWSKLSLTFIEKNEVSIQANCVEKTLDTGKHCLIDRVLTKKPIYVEVMKSMLIKAWKLDQELYVREIGDRMYVFKFKDLLEKEKVVLRQPWSFNKALLVLREFDESEKLDSINLSI